jgi:hypothetical protein
MKLLGLNPNRKLNYPEIRSICGPGWDRTSDLADNSPFTYRIQIHIISYWRYPKNMVEILQTTMIC